MKDTRIDLRDATFLIPVRLDGIKRLENLLMVTTYLQSHFDTNIHILEAAPYDNGLLKSLLTPSIERAFVEDFDPILHRTAYINKMVKNCHTPILSVWDTDVLAPTEQILKAVKMIREEKASFVYPYENKFLDTSFIIREIYRKTLDISVLEENQDRMRELYAPKPVGGAFFAKREKYIEAGMENESFYGWGVEDGERVTRWMALGYTCKWIPGTLYHLTHERGKNSTFHSTKQKAIKGASIHRLAYMSKEEILEEIKGW